MKEENEKAGEPRKSVARRLGVAGFLFFFIKGILWLIVPAIAMALT